VYNLMDALPVLQSFPIVVALETSPNALLSNRAAALHSILHVKHTSLLNTRYLLSARASFDYQTKISNGPVRGMLSPWTPRFAVDTEAGFQNTSSSPIALLQRWYSLVREKRPSRQEFLKSLVKVYQDKPFSQYTQVGNLTYTARA
jgi:cohesin loading factor subunit SCC2